jgi:hypothetical protein
MCAEIYGIDLTKQITPLMVRDAIILCFQDAHCKDTGFDASEKDVNQKYCLEIVKKAFQESNANFDNPTKEDILKATENLSEFAKKFRDQELIKKHYTEIENLIQKLK